MDSQGLFNQTMLVPLACAVSQSPIRRLFLAATATTGRGFVALYCTHFNRLSDMDQARTSLQQDIAAEADLARQVLRAEADAVAGIEIDAVFHDAVGRIADVDGSLVVSGLGKNGPIAQKIVATFSSTGTPAHFLHPTEAMHGDLGRIRRADVVLLLSNSGTTEEIINLAAILKQDGVTVIAMVGKPDCDLARLATLTLSIGDVTEACPMNLAPTASTTAMLALGDAVAICVSQRRRFGVDDFHRFHPGGNLGRQLMPITQAMRFKAGDNLALIPQGLTVRAAYQRAADMKSNLRQAGALLVVDDADRLAGIFTDGDLRKRMVERDVMDEPIASLMVANPRRLPDTALVRDAVHLVREHRIDEVPVVDEDGRPVGLLDVQDLIALKVIEG